MAIRTKSILRRRTRTSSATHSHRISSMAPASSGRAASSIVCAGVGRARGCRGRARAEQGHSDVGTAEGTRCRSAWPDQGAISSSSTTVRPVAESDRKKVAGTRPYPLHRRITAESGSGSRWFAVSRRCIRPTFASAGERIALAARVSAAPVVVNRTSAQRCASLVTRVAIGMWRSRRRPLGSTARQLGEARPSLRCGSAAGPRCAGMTDSASIA